MSLNVAVCPLCKKMHKGRDVCRQCAERLDKAYTVVRDYLYKNPGAGVKELSEKTEVEEGLILHLVRAGRLTFAEGVDTGVYCASCGRPTSGARFCKACSEKMSQSLAGALPRQDQAKASPKDARGKGNVSFLNDPTRRP